MVVVQFLCVTCFKKYDKNEHFLVLHSIYFCVFKPFTIFCTSRVNTLFYEYYFSSIYILSTIVARGFLIDNLILIFP